MVVPVSADRPDELAVKVSFSAAFRLLLRPRVRAATFHGMFTGNPRGGSQELVPVQEGDRVGAQGERVECVRRGAAARSGRSWSNFHQ